MALAPRSLNWRVPNWRVPLSLIQNAVSPSLLLLVWDADGLSALVASRQKNRWQFSREAHSRHSDFALALGEAVALLRQMGLQPPKTCYLAARFIVPARVDIPVSPERPRPFLQMREMMCAEIEAAGAESGSYWTTGAILTAQGRISPEERDRIAQELSARREQSSHPAYFGQTAIDLGIISREDLREASLTQEKLQTLESSLACGWTGFREASDASPVWLASAMGLNLWKQIVAASGAYGIKLAGALPLVWSVSEAPEISEETPEKHPAELSSNPNTPNTPEKHIALEIHPEEIVAVLRHAGRIVAARSEGRMERPLTVDALSALIADWRASGVDTLEIVCQTARDEPEVQASLGTLASTFGQMPLYRDAAAARRALYASLVRPQGRREVTLPVIRFGEPPSPAWKRAGFWHLCCPLLVLAVVAGIHIDQRIKIRTVQTRLDLADMESRRQANIKKQEALAMAQVKHEKEELETTRRELAKILPDIERLQAIEKMTNHLPLLLRAIAASISDDMVLESVRNSRSGGQIGDVMIVAWTVNYASAQAFALRVQGALSGLGYSVAQTDVTSGAGRGGSPGYFVSFWLLPKTGEELGLEEEESKEAETKEQKGGGGAT